MNKQSETMNKEIMYHHTPFEEGRVRVSFAFRKGTRDSKSPSGAFKFAFTICSESDKNRFNYNKGRNDAARRMLRAPLSLKLLSDDVTAVAAYFAGLGRVIVNNPGHWKRFVHEKWPTDES